MIRESFINFSDKFLMLLNRHRKKWTRSGLEKIYLNSVCFTIIAADIGFDYIWFELLISFRSLLIVKNILAQTTPILPHKLQQQPKFTSLIHLWGTFHVIYDIYEAYNFNDIKRVIFYLPRVIWNLRYKRLQYWLIGRQYNEINV